MKSCTAKGYAKLNLTLNVTGVLDGYHALDTVVTTVNKFNKITVEKRKDDKILVTYTGRYGFTPKKQADTNAYKTCQAFIKKYKTSGVNVTLYENIPQGSGMGGSSADIAGTLLALKKLFNISDNLLDLANALGSDSGYLLTGGFARLKGRGDIIECFEPNTTLNFVVIYSSESVNTKECFSVFDSLNENGVISNNDSFIDSLKQEDYASLKTNNGNALTNSAITLNSEIQNNLLDLKSLSPVYAQVTGSGSTVFALFETYELATWAYSKLKRKHYGNVEVLQSYNPSKKPWFLKLKSVYSPITDEELQNKE